MGLLGLNGELKSLNPYKSADLKSSAFKSGNLEVAVAKPAEATRELFGHIQTRCQMTGCPSQSNDDIICVIVMKGFAQLWVPRRGEPRGLAAMRVG